MHPNGYRIHKKKCIVETRHEDHMLAKHASLCEAGSVEMLSVLPFVDRQKESAKAIDLEKATVI